jgi:probable rRNA maturation factor
MTRAGVTVRAEEPGWRSCGIDPGRLRTAARLALARGHEGQPASAARGSVTILLSNDQHLRDLNARFRGKDSPTNVLSFPALPGSQGYLGDVALALGVAGREAAMAGKGLSDHAVHLTVHGVLHLLGYDHVKAGEAQTMERLEIAVLHELGIRNPYAAST